MDSEAQFTQPSKSEIRAENREELITKSLEEVVTRLEEQDSGPLQPRVALLADKDHIQDQQIDFILDNQFNRIRVQMKLRPMEYEKLRARILSQPDSYSRGQIIYGDISGEDDDFFSLTDTWYKDYGDINLHVAKAEIDGSRINTAEGLIHIDIPFQGQDCKNTLLSLAQKLDGIISNDIGISDWIEEPKEQDKIAWMLYRYSAQSRINVEEIKDRESVLSKLSAKEVLPEYWAPVLEARHQELKEKYGEYAIYHNFGLNRLVNLAKAGAMYSSHERFRRGLIVSGNSTYTDFKTGGAEGVFTRTISERAIVKQDKPYGVISCVAILDPSEFNRTDMYAYPGDWYGSTGSLDKRMTPEEFLAYIEQEGMENYKNEQIFNRGAKIKAFAVPIGQREELLASLRDAGVFQMNGKSIEDCVIEATDEYDLFDISWNRTPRSISQQVGLYE